MRDFKTVFSTSSAMVAIMFSVAGASVPVQNAQAWFTCHGSYEFRTKSNNKKLVQCIKFAKPSCPSGYQYGQDQGPGGQDICYRSGRPAITVSCPSSYELAKVNGLKDQCRKSRPPTKDV